MDLFFKPTKGSNFTMEIGYFDSVLEIKEKVQKYQGIPVSKQVFIFNGQVLPDDLNVHYSQILDQSSIQLIMETNKNIHRTTKDSFQIPKKTKILLKLPSPKQATMLELDPNESVRQLKQRIHELENVPVNRLVLQTNGYELHDNRLLREYDALSKTLEIEITIRPSPASSSSTSSGNTTNDLNKKLKLMVLTKCGSRKIAVEVKASDKVLVLKKELINLKQQFQFILPSEGYFFIYNQNVMDEDRSFSWHQVNQGDTIEIFGGTVTGGS